MSETRTGYVGKIDQMMGRRDPSKMKRGEAHKGIISEGGESEFE